MFTGKIKSIFKGHKSVVRDVAWSPTENEIIAASVSDLYMNIC